MQPINYSLDVQSPFEASMKGYNQGVLQRKAEQEISADQQKQLFEQQKQEQLIARQRDLAEFTAKKNPSAEDYAALMIKYNDIAEPIKKSWEVLNPAQQQNALTQVSQVHSALETGNNQVAIDLLRNQSDAYRNSGDTKQAKEAEDMIKLIETNPQGAKIAAAGALATILGPEKFGENLAKIRTLPSAVAQSEALAEKTRAEAANTPERLYLESNYKKAQVRDLDSQIAKRAEQLNFDKDKLQTEVQMKLYELDQKKNPALNLGDDARKIINEAAISSTTSEQSANQLLDLANRLQKEAPTAGKAGSWGESLKRVSGSEDAITQLRKDYLRIRNNQVIKLLPRGPASDKDIAFATAPFPDETASPEVLASTLRGLAKLEQYNAVVENVKSEWVNNVGHLGKTKQEIEIDGVQVPAGATFNNFASEFLAKKQQELAQRQAQQNLPNRSYMQLAQPQGQ